MLGTMMSRGEHDDVKNDDVEEEDDDNEDDDVGEEDRSQNRDTRLVRACAVEMRMDMSQEPLYVEIYK